MNTGNTHLSFVVHTYPMAGVIHLDLNESYWLLDDQTLSQMRDLPRESLGIYPDYSLLIQDVASYARAPQASVCLAPGSDEAIRASVKLCTARGYRAAFVLPTFSGYERVLMEIPLAHDRLYYREVSGGFEFPYDEVQAAISSGAIQAIFLCEPNNPLGSALDPLRYSVLLDAARDHNVLVVVDEAYIDFGGTSVQDRLGLQQLILLRTLSKAFGVPGIRVGYALSDPETTAALRSIIFGTLPWPIPGPSVHIARTALSFAPHIAMRRQEVISEGTRFAADLARISGMTVFPSVGNFFLSRHVRASEIAVSLSEQGILVGVGERKTWDPRSAALLKSTLRLAIPSPLDSARVIKALSEACA